MDTIECPGCGKEIEVKTDDEDMEGPFEAEWPAAGYKAETEAHTLDERAACPDCDITVYIHHEDARTVVRPE